MATMASPRSSASCSAASLPEETVVVNVLDSIEPLPASSSSVPTCLPAESSVVNVLDSCEPLPTSSSPVPPCLPAESSVVNVLDSCEPLPTSSSAVPPCSSTGGQAMDSFEPIAGPSSVEDDVDDFRVPLASLTESSGRRIHYYAEELRLMWNPRRIYARLGTPEQCIAFALERHLLPTEKICPHHHRPMSLTEGKAFGQVGIFRCRKSNCRSRAMSRAAGTWFENARLPLTKVFEIMFAFSDLWSYDQAQKYCVSDDSDTVISQVTVSDWYNYCRETIIIYELEHQEAQSKIGGAGKVVQIDESKFGKRKYNRGRQIEGHWVIRMIENGSDDLRLEVCPNNERSSQILVPLIQKHVEEGSEIHTDFWRAYDCLPQHNYTHKKVNHSDPENRFVAPDGTHTQRIESQWRGLKRAFGKDWYKGNFTDWLIEYSWRRKIRINHLDPFEELLKAVEYVYRL